MVKDRDLHLVRAIAVRVECFHCKGKGSVPGGQVEYGEVIACPVCNGRSTLPESVTIDQLRKLLAV